MIDKQTIKSQLESSRQRLLEVLEGVGGDQWNIQVQSEGDQWTVLHMLRHLQDAHQGLTGQVERLLVGQPTVPEDFDVDRWNKGRQKKLVDMLPQDALANLHASHEKLLGIVGGLNQEDFAKTGFSPALKRAAPLDEILQIIAVHEATHAGEIAAALKK